ncbi:uncharacterized protein SPSK_05423 [Sporothrix schenckii 1099-18]|uniref:RNA polymerase II subunit B1 CTD phosphatase RPAP2 homolog n=2 Tax=Sporothrix schenckii TaxID=29908 RepID=U7Q746_SPOS1|nr:uncharacterized protein SPSK_05423 [Sporothrix schenckii 1099-18]ERT02541.1 hypothetical protein HMPREF1624_00841 [Sporothrix schenckii ATCC 58251]KJR80170.1 hypothetical protein SPSK_05423 [Sporothrix schenckii 1099-18]
MAAPDRQLKSILKKPSAPAPDVDDNVDDVEDDGRGAVTRPATHSRRVRSEQENAEIAKKHADILQQRRELESAIFLSIETLTELPRVKGAGFSAATPADEDVEKFTSLVRIFQPSDYDDLIEERNTYGHCGYVLCPKPRQTFAGNGTWKLVNTGRKDFGIVAKKEIEKWCSSQCARRALYIKVQLNETAAWERAGIPDIRIELMDEGTPKGKKAAEVGTAEAAVANEAQLAQDLARLKLGEERRLAQNANALAMERGDAGHAGVAAALTDLDDNNNDQPPRIVPPMPTALVDVNIVEKKVITAPTAPTLETGDAPDSTGGDTSHMVVEGHKIRFRDD